MTHLVYLLYTAHIRANSAYEYITTSEKTDSRNLVISQYPKTAIDLTMTLRLQSTRLQG